MTHVKRHPRPPTKGERKENEWKRERGIRGAASKLAQGRRRNPTERYKFDFIALLELMLEASTNRHHRVAGGDGGRRKRTAQLKEAASERETAARKSVGRPTGGFPMVAGKQGRAMERGWRRRLRKRHRIIMMLKYIHR